MRTIIDRHDMLDRISPDEAHLPPSARSWARLIQLRAGDALELRDPNDGLSGDPDRVARHQYVVAERRLFRRRLPPAPLAHIEDAYGAAEPQDVWTDDPHASDWSVIPLAGLVGEWARAQGAVDGLTEPRRTIVEADLHGTGYRRHVAYEMPPRHPADPWAAITGAHCPMAGCDQVLVWDEAGRVPGARACMRPIDDRRFDAASRRHEWLLSTTRQGWGLVLDRTIR